MKILFIARKSLYDQPGGDSLQIEQTAHFLRLLGHEVTISTSSKEDTQPYDIVHLFNIIRPAQFLYYLKFKVPIVLTSIYVDYSEYELKSAGGIRKLLLKTFGKFGLEYFKTLGRWLNKTDAFPGWRYLLIGQKRSIQQILNKTEKLVVASNQEAEKMQKELGLRTPFCKIALGHEHFQPEDSKQPREGIACVARIEGLKNQYQLIEAANQGHENLKIIGKAAANQAGYYSRCKEVAGKTIEFLGRLSKNEIAKILSETEIHALLSYYETTGLSTIEALKSGCQVLISEKGGQKEIFGDHAFYADLEDPKSILQGILRARESKLSHKDWVMKTFSWEKSAAEISDIYSSLSKAQ